MTLEDDLLAAIAADVDADAPRLVYADWLSTTGDARGEQIILQHQLAGNPGDWHGEAQTRVRELDRALIATLCGGTMQPEVIGRIRLGFVDRLKLTRRAVSAIRAQPAWLDAPAVRFVRELDVAIIDPNTWDLVAAWRHRNRVRRIEHGSTDTAIAPANLAAIVAHLPQITELLLRAPGHLELSNLASLQLDTFEFVARPIEDRTLADVFAMPWRLRTLSLRSDPGASFAALAPLLDGRVFPEVRDLELIGYSAAAVVEALVASGRIATIDTLRMEFTKVLVTELVRFRDALARVRLELPIQTSAPPEGTFAVVLAQLGHDAAALEPFSRTNPVRDDGEWLRWYATSVRRVGGRSLARALVARLLDERGGDNLFAELLVVTDELLAGGDRDPALVLQRARALAALDRGGEALVAIAEAPAVPSAHLVRALAYDQVGDAARSRDALAALEGCGVAWRAYALLVGRRFDEVVDGSCVRPAAIAAALGGAGASRPEAFDAAEVAIIAAACAGDRKLVRARMAALVGTELRDRAWNPDLIAACRFRERELDPRARAFASKVHASLQGRSARQLSHVVQFDHLVRLDPWLAG